MNIFADEVPTFWDSFFQDIGDWIARNLALGLRILIVVIVAKIINSYSERIVTKLLQQVIRNDMYSSKVDRDRRLQTLTSILNVLIHFTVWLVAFIIIIGFLGINATAIIASAGIIGAGLAFGAQSLVKDFLSGVFIISENQYRVGDYIEVMNVSGTVQTIGLRTTVLRDLSGSVHHIPNGSIVVTTNKTIGNGQINLDVNVAADTDIELLKHQINHAGQRLANRAALKDSILEAPHFSRISEITGAQLTAKVVGKTVGNAQLEVKSALLVELKKSFDEHKIKFSPAAPTPPKKKK